MEGTAEVRWAAATEEVLVLVHLEVEDHVVVGRVGGRHSVWASVAFPEVAGSDGRVGGLGSGSSGLDPSSNRVPAADVDH